MNATTMKQSFPIKFNGDAVIFPLTWEEHHTDVVTTVLLENGEDHFVYARKDKLKISASWRCTEEWVSFFRRFANKGIFFIDMYNTETKGYEKRKVRIHDFKCGLIKGTWDLYVSNGIWDVSCEIEEV